MNRNAIFCCLALAVTAINHANAQNQDALAPDRLPPMAATSATAVPMLVRYDGMAASGKGKVSANMTFLIFKEEKGGEPLWIETQSVATDAVGKYEVYLGSTYTSGLPPSLFGTGEARWLEVQIAGETPAPRTLLTSVPYALKAADAATLGGLPASAFALAGTTGIGSAQGNAITPDAASNVTTTGGTSLYLPKFNAASTVIDSEIYDTGTSVGIGVVPNAGVKLDVGGAMIMRGNMTVSRTGNATASKAYPSYGFDFFSNLYNSSTKAGDNPYFQLQSEPTGNNTASPSATFNLLFANNGSAAAETGFYINPDGTIHFASGQTLPATSSISGTAVDGTSTSGIGVEGTSTSNVGVAGYSTSSSGIYGNTQGSAVNTAGVAGQAGQASGFGGIAGVWGDSYSHVGTLGTSYQQVGVEGVSSGGQGVYGSSVSNSGVQGISTSGTGVAGTSTSANGVLGYTGGGINNTGGVVGQAGGTSGFGGIAGVWGDASAHVGVFGSSNQYAGVSGFSTFGPGIQGVGSVGPGVTGTSTLGYAGSFTSSGSNATLYASNSNSSSGGFGVYSISSGPEAAALYGNAQGAGGIAVEGVASGGTDSSNGIQPVGVSGSASGYGVKGTSQNVGVYGIGGSSLNPTGPGATGVWGDSTGAARDSATAVLGTTTDNTAAEFENNSNVVNNVFADATLVLINYGSGPTTSDTFRTLEASTSDGTCGFGNKGNLICTGQLKSLATTGGGSRTVETYSMQSPENWMEDFGSGTLQSGVATISLEAAFAETISGTADYHVFLTPNGDSKGLYVFAKTATGFEVRESGGGTSTIGFDYRIVAKRRGFEAQRMIDVTEAMKAVNARKAERFAKAAKTYQAPGAKPQ